MHTLLLRKAASVAHRVQEHRPPGSIEQPIFDEHPGSGGPPASLWDSCEVIAYFALEVCDPGCELEFARTHHESPVSAEADDRALIDQ